MGVVTVSILFVLILQYDTVTILPNIEDIAIISIYHPSLFVGVRPLITKLFNMWKKVLDLFWI